VVMTPTGLKAEAQAGSAPVPMFPVGAVLKVRDSQACAVLFCLDSAPWHREGQMIFCLRRREFIAGLGGAAQKGLSARVTARGPNQIAEHRLLLAGPRSARVQPPLARRAGFGKARG
jgi:hypothetical protein